MHLSMRLTRVGRSLSGAVDDSRSVDSGTRGLADHKEDSRGDDCEVELHLRMTS